MRLVPEGQSYADCYDGFRWAVPQRFNIAEACCDRHAVATPENIALITEDEAGIVQRYTFHQLRQQANRFANALQTLGIARGDRVGVLLPQGLDCVVAHLACLKLGAITVPLSTLFGPDGLRHRLGDAGAVAVVGTRQACAVVASISDDLPDLSLRIASDSADAHSTHDMTSSMATASETFQTLDTSPDDPAFLIYTSGTTGLAKGALHGHRILLGHLPGVEFSLDFLPQPDDIYWSPADWSWVAGLVVVLFAGLYHGIPVVAHRPAKFDPAAAFGLMARHQVTTALLPPTALKLMRQVHEPKRYGYNLRAISSGGEALGDELIGWGKETFGLTINEVFGQTEMNLVVVANASVMNVPAGAMGRATPGHIVEIVDDDGNVLPAGTQGLIAARRPHPALFLEYWGNPEATVQKFLGDWCVLGDLGVKDSDGFFFFKGRADDIINTAGYRVGPVEIEECLLRHPAVAMAGVVGKPDPIRGAVVKAFVVLAANFEPSETLASDIATSVKLRLAAHQYPREIVFLDEMPLTESGKIRRSVLRNMG